MTSALIEIRLSNETEESTSPERQLDQGTRYCELRGWDIAHVARDLDVSGAISPFDREDLGPWLTVPELIDKWDVLVVARLDRLARSVFGYADLLRWCEDHGKSLVSVSEALDFSTAMGRACAMVIMVFAALMREQTAENRRAAQATLRAAMLYGGGWVHYGYEKYKQDGHWPLRLCKTEVERVNYWADEITEHGRSCSSLTIEMNRAGIRNKYGRPWSDGRILEILRSPGLRGYVLYWPPKRKGQKKAPPPQIVLGDDGMPLRREPVLTDKKWFALQAVLDRNSHASSTVRRDAAPLLGVVHCSLCAMRLAADVRLTLNHYYGKYSYYRCPNIVETRSGPGKKCPSKAIPAAWLEAKTREIFLAEAGDVPIKTRIVTPDTSNAEQIAAIGRQIADLTTERFVLGVQREDYDRHIDSLTKQHAELSAAPGKPPEVRWQKTGRTVADEWAARDENGQRMLMIEAGFSIRVAKLNTGYVLSHTFDPDLERRAGLAATGAREVPVIPNELTGVQNVIMLDLKGQESPGGEILAELGVTADTED